MRLRGRGKWKWYPNSVLGNLYLTHAALGAFRWSVGAEKARDEEAKAVQKTVVVPPTGTASSSTPLNPRILEKMLVSSDTGGEFVPT